MSRLCEDALATLVAPPTPKAAHLFLPPDFAEIIRQICRIGCGVTDGRRFPTSAGRLQNTLIRGIESGISRRCPVYGYGGCGKTLLISPYTGYTGNTSCPHTGLMEGAMYPYYGQEEVFGRGGLRFGFGSPLGFQVAYAPLGHDCAEISSPLMVSSASHVTPYQLALLGNRP